MDGGEGEVTAPGKLPQSAGCLSLTRSALGVAWGGAAPPFIIGTGLSLGLANQGGMDSWHGGTGLLPKSHHPGAR